MDSLGTMFIGFGRSSASEFPSSYVSGKRRSDTSIQPSTRAKAGTAATSQSRWGDYTGIDMDETASGPSASYAWYDGQWTKGSNTFGTWITQLSFTYGKIISQALFDADGDTLTSGDRTPLAGVTMNLKQGSTIVATTSTDNSGNCTFGYLETGTYDLVSVPTGYVLLTVIPGSGGNSQTRTGFDTIQVSLTNNQTSSGNTFILWSNPLPIQLASFTAQPNPNGNGVLLEWMTITEVNNYGFYVERRRDNEPNFSDIPNNFVPGHGTTTEPQYYSFVDQNIPSPGVYHYRLRQVDLDGTVHYSFVVTIDLTVLATTERMQPAFHVEQNYPNPFNPSTTITFSVDREERTTVIVYNILGVEVARLYDEIAQPGILYKLKVNASDLSSGAYFYRVSTPTHSAVKKIVVMK